MPRATSPAKKTTAAKKAKKKSTAKRSSATKGTTAKSAAKQVTNKKGAAKKAATKKAPAKKTAAKKAAAKKAPARKRSVKLDAFTAAQREALLEERATYTRQAETLQAEADLLAEEREPGDVQFDEESGEGDTLAVERERDLALSAQARAAVEEIDSALARIANGTYGICEQCGQKIPRERLKALPHAALCVACKSGGLGRR